MDAQILKDILAETMADNRRLMAENVKLLKDKKNLKIKTHILEKRIINLKTKYKKKKKEFKKYKLMLIKINRKSFKILNKRN